MYNVFIMHLLDGVCYLLYNMQDHFFFLYEQIRVILETEGLRGQGLLNKGLQGRPFEVLIGEGERIGVDLKLVFVGREMAQVA